MKYGFEPVFDQNSRVLILGSFPSVKSREVGFYYGNPHNRFWGTVCGFFGEEIPSAVEGKREFLLRRGIALWDVVLGCEITGSSDASIRQETVADLPSLLSAAPIERILCNGSKSYELLQEHYPLLAVDIRKLSSTSPANPRFSVREWYSALSETFSSETERSEGASDGICKNREKGNPKG